MRMASSQCSSLSVRSGFEHPYSRAREFFFYLLDVLFNLTIRRIQVLHEEHPPSMGGGFGFVPVRQGKPESNSSTAWMRPSFSIFPSPVTEPP